MAKRQSGKVGKRKLAEADGTAINMRNFLGWLETRLAQITLDYMEIAECLVFFKVVWIILIVI